ncbi:unnamed protein product [Rangifer tarandus platyrhynchus]|uniref:Uncharacterized protein n=2 Tax=Rangifer tarandus platyrhynchus TaxID=3082113 RepID=A0ABN8XWQ4_RANTA|nr:unnamed protein product [Rangifer tarandus platyrhynchus]CAI9691903.1 unnamed protein product [Rangifer tarandus platyrhynchus]
MSDPQQVRGSSERPLRGRSRSLPALGGRSEPQPQELLRGGSSRPAQAGWVLSLGTGPACLQQLGHSRGARAGPGQAPEGVELAKEPP